MTDKTDTILKELAYKLAINRINVSLWNAINSNEEVYEKVLDTSLCNEDKRRERFIVIVGAGASHDAYSKLLLGEEASKKLKTHFENKLGKEATLINDELTRLERVYQLNRKDFESIMLAISKFFPRLLNSKITNQYSETFRPSLTYEIIAHMMKNRFVDAVINFNFDELLDQAIEDELGQEEYKKVIMESDYDESSIMDNPGLKYPIYLKPHGTSSNPSSLRFTREDYFALPPGISSLITKLLSGTCMPISKDIIPVNLIIIGFNMQSFEFNMLCEEKLPKNSKIYFINTKKLSYPNLTPQIANKIQHKRKKSHSIYAEENNKFIEINQEKNKLDTVLGKLYEEIENCYQVEYKPRGIIRHKLISALFKKHKLIVRDNLLEYLKDRTWVELTLSIAKYKGFVCFNQLVNDRFGKYFALYRQELGKILTSTSKSLPTHIYPRTIPQFCNKIGLHPLGYSSKDFSLDPAAKKSRTISRTSLTVSKKHFLQQRPKIIQKLTRKVNEYTKSRLKNSQYKEECKGTLLTLFEDTLETLFMKEDSEVSPKFNNGYNNLFLRPEPIKTTLSLDYYTRSFLGKKDWSTLLVVAETGEWILNKANNFSDKNIFLVIADNAKKKALNKKVQKKNWLEPIHQMYWWQHNQHMTIFLKGKKPNYKPIRAIYFERRHRSTHIHPLILKNAKDCNLVLKVFAGLCKKSQNIIAYKKKKLSSEVQGTHINNFLKKYFKNLEKKGTFTKY